MKDAPATPVPPPPPPPVASPSSSSSSPSPPSAGRRLASLLAAEPASVLESIAGFLPLTPDDDDGGDACPAHTSNLRALVALCRALPGCGAHLGPTNEPFWRARVLGHFDFARDRDYDYHFNIDDLQETWMATRGARFSDDEEGGDDAEDDDDQVQAPDDEDQGPAADARHAEMLEAMQRAMDERNARSDRGVVGWMLEDPLINWCNFDAWTPEHGDYAFLPKLQGVAPSQSHSGDEGEDDAHTDAPTWPREIEAFGLYCDLVVLKDRLCPLDSFETCDPAEIYASVLGCYDAPIPVDSYKFLQFCGFCPRFWDGKVSRRWSGLDAANGGGDGTEGHATTNSDAKMFPPLENSENAARLRDVVRSSFSDWRFVRYADKYKLATVDFYIGQRPRTKRWLGFFRLRNGGTLHEYYMGFQSRLMEYGNL